MKKAKQPEFFDLIERTDKLTKMGDPLVGLNAKVDWGVFRPARNRVYEKERRSNSGEENALIKEGAAPIEWANTTKNTNWLKRTPMSAGQKRTTQTTTATRTTSTPIKITSFFGNLECHLRCAV